MIGDLKYVEKCTQGDISYATYQYTRFSPCSETENGTKIRWIGRYLRGIQTKGSILKPNTNGLEMYVNADFVGNWDAKEVLNG